MYPLTALPLLVVALLASVLGWRSVNNPVLFTITVFLVLLGLSQLLPALILLSIYAVYSTFGLTMRPDNGRAANFPWYDVGVMVTLFVVGIVLVRLLWLAFRVNRKNAP